MHYKLAHIFILWYHHLNGKNSCHDLIANPRMHRLLVRELTCSAPVLRPDAALPMLATSKSWFGTFCSGAVELEAADMLDTDDTDSARCIGLDTSVHPSVAKGKIIVSCSHFQDCAKPSSILWSGKAGLTGKRVTVFYASVMSAFSTDDNVSCLM